MKHVELKLKKLVNTYCFVSEPVIPLIEEFLKQTYLFSYKTRLRYIEEKNYNTEIDGISTDKDLEAAEYFYRFIQEYRVILKETI